MLTHCEQFFNSFSASATPAWQMARAWRTRSPWRLARIRCSLQAVHRTPRCLLTPTLHVIRTGPPTPRAAACTWWTPRSVSLLDTYPRTRHPQPYILARVAACPHIPDCFVVIVLEYKAWCILLAYFGETAPRTLGRRPSYFGETESNSTFCF